VGMSKQKISITVPSDAIEKVDGIAERRRRSRSFIIAEAVEKYLENGRSTSTQKTASPTKKAGTR
jgi:metal-responsive CopG/Arc/MetJ family transcriptional regulator